MNTGCIICRKLFAGEFADRADDDGNNHCFLIVVHVLLECDIYVFVTYHYFLDLLFVSVSQFVRTDQFSSIGISGLSQLAKLVSIDVGEIGVGGAKDFFESKIHLANRSNKFEEEVRTCFHIILKQFCPHGKKHRPCLCFILEQIKQEQQEKKKELEEKKKRQEEFKNKQANFV